MMNLTGFTLFTNTSFTTLDYRMNGSALPIHSVPVAMQANGVLVRLNNQEQYDKTTFAEKLAEAVAEFAAFS